MCPHSVQSFLPPFYPWRHAGEKRYQVLCVLSETENGVGLGTRLDGYSETLFPSLKCGGHFWSKGCRGSMYCNLPIILPWAMSFSGYPKRRVGVFRAFPGFHSKVGPPTAHAKCSLYECSTTTVLVLSTNPWDLLVGSNTLSVCVSSCRNSKQGTARVQTQQKCLCDMDHTDYQYLQMSNCSCFREIYSALPVLC